MSTFKLRNQRMISALWTFSNLLLLRYLIFLQNIHFTQWNLKSIGGISYFQKKMNNSMTLGLYFYFLAPYHFSSRADKSKFGWYQIGNRIISKMPYCSKVWAIHQRIKNNYWAIQNWTFSNLFYLGICFSVLLILDQLQYTIIIIKVLTIFQT